MSFPMVVYRNMQAEKVYVSDLTIVLHGEERDTLIRLSALDSMTQHINTIDLVSHGSVFTLVFTDLAEADEVWNAINEHWL